MNYFFKDLVLLVLSVCVCRYPWRLEGSDPPGGEVTSSHPSPDMGAGT